MRSRTMKAIIAVTIAVAGVVTVAAPASAGPRVVGPFSTLTQCNGERAIWRAEGYTTGSCWIGANGSDYYFWAS